MDTPAATAPLLGRCRECDYALFATDADVKEANSLREVTAGTGAYRVNNGYLARCVNGHKVFPLRRVEGTYSPDHKCDARCLNAKGHKCTCSCGGANHGRGHAAIVVEASATPSTPEPERRHLGEVGKHITGKVIVKSIKSLSNSTLITFRTLDGDVIKWFAPSYAVPDWDEGDGFTLRAKVRAHEDHEQYGKSTIVIYAEKVEE